MTMANPHLAQPYLTIASLVDRVNAHLRHLGGDGIDFPTAALVRSLVAEVVRIDPRLTSAMVEPICETIGVGLDNLRPAFNVTETDRG